MHFGNYELIEKLSSGGMAEVFRARLTGRDGFVKEFAIKRILPHLATDENFGRLFVNEARVAARLRHANIVQVFDFGDVAGSPFIAMELIEGRDLRSIQKLLAARHERMPINLTSAICCQVLKALHYAHNLTDEQGLSLDIIHRDVTPHNVLVSLAGEIKLADFGIAKAVFTTAHTAQGLVRGKLQYMSPEQIQGRALTQKTDIFSLGVIWYELLTGARLYSAKRGLNLVQQILHAHLPPPSTHVLVPPTIDRVVMAMLTRDPDRRPDARTALSQLQHDGWAQDQSLALADLLRHLDLPKTSRVAAASAALGEKSTKDPPNEFVARQGHANEANTPTTTPKAPDAPVLARNDNRARPQNAVPQEVRSDAPTLILEDEVDLVMASPQARFATAAKERVGQNQPTPTKESPASALPPRTTSDEAVLGNPRTGALGRSRLFLRGGLAIALIATMVVIFWALVSPKSDGRTGGTPCARPRPAAFLTLTKPTATTSVLVRIDGRPLPAATRRVALPAGVHRLEYTKSNGQPCGGTQILTPAGSSQSVPIPSVCIADTNPKDQVQP